MKKRIKNYCLTMTLLAVVCIAFLSMSNYTFSQSGLPCEQALFVPPGSVPQNPIWSEDQNDNNATINVAECPGCTITSYTYKTRQWTNAQGRRYTDIVITGYTTNAACNNCDYNVFEHILWGIWMQNKDAWGLENNHCLENYRISASSCWRTTISNYIQAFPCSSTCCMQYYVVCRASGNVFFHITDPLPITNNCTVSPCTYFVCDKLSNISMTEPEANDMRNANPQLFGKRQVDDQQSFSVSILPNPSTGLISLEIKNVQNEILTFKITDILGNVLFTTELQPSNGYLFTNITLQNISSGSYIASLQQSGKTIYSENIKIIK